MLGKTSLSAIRALLFLAQQEQADWWSPRRLAAELGESPTYLAKVLRHLVKAGTLDVARGVRGGVRLARRPNEVTLLEIVEACQGAIVGDYCRSDRKPPEMCSFHLAALELHGAIQGVLESWSLQRLLERPESRSGRSRSVPCLMRGVSVAVSSGKGRSKAPAGAKQ